MKITKLLKKQKELDDAIQKKHNVTSEEIINLKIIALYVEIGEFINEIANFKYWKSNKNISKNKILEEYVDCLHFYLTLFIYKDLKKDVKTGKTKNDFNEMTLDLYKSIANLQEELNEKNLHKSFKIFLAIGKSLNFDWKEIEEYYLIKNKINFQRLKNNY